jgi:hypothetical protein
MVEEDPNSILRPEDDPSRKPEWRAALARILDAHPLPESMLRAGVQDTMRKYIFPNKQFGSSSPSPQS